MAFWQWRRGEKRMCASCSRYGGEGPKEDKVRPGRGPKRAGRRPEQENGIEQRMKSGRRWASPAANEVRRLAGKTGRGGSRLSTGTSLWNTQGAGSVLAENSAYHKALGFPGAFFFEGIENYILHILWQFIPPPG